MSGPSNGFHSSLRLDEAGNPVIAYQTFSSAGLKVTRCDDANCAGGETVITVAAAEAWRAYASLVLGSDGNPIIAFQDTGTNDVAVVWCGDASCSSGNTSAVLTGEADVGYHTSLVLDADGDPLVAYYDMDNDDLRLAGFE